VSAPYVEETFIQVLVVDVGGTNMKSLAGEWTHDVVAIEYPEPVVRDRDIEAP